MKSIRTYHIAWVMLLLTMAGCAGKRINDRITFWRGDKLPYGAWYAYNQLNHLFPEADIVINKSSPGEKTVTYLPRDEYGFVYDPLDRKMLYLVLTDYVDPDRDEINALLEMVQRGHHVFISSVQIGNALLDTLHLATGFKLSFLDDSLTVKVFHPLSYNQESYTYPGRAYDNHFVQIDSSITTVLGTDELGQPNYVKLQYEGGGAIYLHLAPIAFTNFFLLHKGNKGYYDNVLSYVPQDIGLVKWDDYFRYYAKGDSGDGSGKGFNALGWIAGQPGLGMALFLLIVLLLLIYLFESKRKQRIIPVKAPLKNASLDFVKTIGRLYYQRRDNKNLSQKMIAHFMDHVRSKYNIRVSQLDEDFEKRLAWKTGYDPAAIKALLRYMQYVQDQPKLSDEGLLELNSRLEKFYERERSAVNNN